MFLYAFKLKNWDFYDCFYVYAESYSSARLYACQELKRMGHNFCNGDLIGGKKMAVFCKNNGY